ncbi:hypothetical protein ACS0TY_026432 [Phlomoides rotata]
MGMWVRMYDLPIAARSEKHLLSIANRCGEVVEIDKTSTMGFGRSIRVKELLNIPDEKLPYGDWMKASPSKRASVTTTPNSEKKVTSLLRCRLFEKLKVELIAEETE